MERTSVDKNEILSEANKLVSNGLHKAAIDLLLEYLEVDSNSLTILSALGRAYLFDHQPEKSVIYLKRSLKISQSINAQNKPTSKHQAEGFSDDDMAYVDSQADTSAEVEYQPEADDTDSQVGNKGWALSSEIMPLPATSQPREQAKTSLKKTDDAHVSGHSRQLSLPPTRMSSRLNHPAIESTDDVLPRLESTQLEDKPVAIIEPGTVDASHGIQKKQQPPINNSLPTKTKTLGYPQREEDKGLAPENQDDLSLENIDDIDLIENGEPFPNELFEDDTDTEELNDDLSDEIESLTYPPLVEEETDELRWNDFKDLDEFDELTNREVKEDVQDKGKINREERAKQIAVIVLDESGWGTKHLPLLQQVFFENGWSAARTAIQREIARGLLPEELALARKIKRLWSENEQYWITFHKIKTNAYSQQADAAYKQMSWLESLRIIRSFPQLPEIEEIYAFFDWEYDYWYNSDRLRRIFKAFYKYLRYRTGLMRRTLPGDCIYSFHDSVNADVGVDAEDLLNPITPIYQKLEQLGVSLRRWPRAQENKMKISDNFLNPSKPKASSKPELQSTAIDTAGKQQSKWPQTGPSFGFGSSIAIAAKGSD